MKEHADRFSQVFTEHYDFLKYYLLKLGAKPEDCDDILQDAFMRCFPLIQSHTERDHRRFLFTVVRNLHIDRYRFNKKFASELTATFFDNIAEDRSQKCEHWQRAIVEKIMDYLPESPESRFFIMHYRSGLKIKEIAAITETPQGTVAAQIFRFRKRLSSLIRKYFDSVDDLPLTQIPSFKIIEAGLTRKSLKTIS